MNEEAEDGARFDAMHKHVNQVLAQLGPIILKGFLDAPSKTGYFALIASILGGKLMASEAGPNGEEYLLDALPKVNQAIREEAFYGLASMKKMLDTIPPEQRSTLAEKIRKSYSG